LNLGTRKISQSNSKKQGKEKEGYEEERKED